MTKPSAIIGQLSQNGLIFDQMFKNLPEELITWKPHEKAWCYLEILCHLVDEEVEDFRTRVKNCLENPGKHPPAISPGTWVKERNYITQDFNEKLRTFMQERTKSIEWLASLQNPDWSASYNHNSLGSLSALFFLNNWLAHDYLHMRQLTRLKYQYLQKSSNEALDYAGNW